MPLTVQLILISQVKETILISDSLDFGRPLYEAGGEILCVCVIKKYTHKNLEEYQIKALASPH